MRPSVSSLRHVPLIKFVGGKHTFEGAIDSSIRPHAFSAGIIPGGEGAIKVSTLPKRPAAPKPVQSKQTVILKPSDKPYDFVSVADLPKRFKPYLPDDLEIDAVNGGGAGLLI